MAGLTAIAEARAKGLNRLLVQAATGIGKTTMFAALPTYPGLSEWLGQFDAKDRRMLVIAHREELIDQAARRIHQQNPDLHVSVEQADRYASRFSDVVVASIQTLAGSEFKRLKNLMAHGIFRLVVCDEAHHSSAPTWRTALVHLEFLPSGESSTEENSDAPMYHDIEAMRVALEGWDAVAPKDRLLIGVTATPNRSDAIGLSCVFQSMVYSYPLKQAVSDGWLVPPVPWVIETAENLDEVKTVRGDFNQKQLAEAVNTDRRNQLAVAGWLEHAAALPTIAFTVDVAHAHALAAEFIKNGIVARAVSGETPKDTRRSILSAYARGEVQVLTNCMVFSEGTDLPKTACILMAKPTKSATLYEQMAGRGLRMVEGKASCIILDVVDVARRHSLQTAPVLFGLPPTLTCDGVSLSEAAADLEALLERYPSLDLSKIDRRITLEQLRAKASTFDIWSVRPLGLAGAGLSMNWVRVGDSAFRLQYPWKDGTECLTVEPDIVGHYDLVATYRSRPVAGTVVTVRQRTLVAGVESAPAALAKAEAFMAQERQEVSRLKSQDAPWRRNRVSEKQLAMLRRLKVPHQPAGLLAGQASDLIDIAMARKGR